ncbi:hypothetical protein C9374_000705 [Naegleria lovaniensis]|uniref:Uncharacterized protein n=1 Tax=Naegleria lovaniensis TaxID=51637 RepID=A0AA88KPF0_NAELO|nr:uncharacterized protein C9374_000705 [Naegleria lovaniensis]KAG2388541.1 hypothetical protein C9374_000705 [Naegleria lovaniensis]
MASHDSEALIMHNSHIDSGQRTSGDLRLDDTFLEVEGTTTTYYHDDLPTHSNRVNNHNSNHLKKFSSTPMKQFMTYLFIGFSTLIVLALLSALIIIVIYNVANPMKPPIHETPLNSTVILVSIDGFRAQYLTQCMAQQYCENLKLLVQSGATSSKGFQPVFPSKTFPNHYSIVTGLYAESHGIVSNSFYDPSFNAVFKLGSDESLKPRWWLGEPIWNTAEKQRVISGSFFWPGSDVAIQGRYPTYYKVYDGSVPYSTRIHTLLKWLDEKEKVPQLLLTYFDGVDSNGHSYGPNSNNVINAIREVDESIGLLMTGLEQRNISQQVNLLIVSDHGMAETPSSKIIRVSDILGRDIVDGSKVKNFNNGPFFDFYFQDESQIDIIYGELTASIVNSATFSEGIQGVYTRKNMPARFHYTNSNRIADIVILGKVGYSILRSSTSSLYGNGNHGYDNEAQDMMGLFIAKGPLFKSGFTSPDVIHNIDVYPLVCEILKIKPAPNNGTLSTISQFLKQIPKK